MGKGKKNSEQDDWIHVVEEVVLMASCSPQGEWTFVTSDLSASFLFALGPNWDAEKTTSYYVDFWEPVMKQLEGRTAATEITLNLEHWQGVLEKPEAAQWMEKWRTDKVVYAYSNLISVELYVDNTVTMCRTQITGVQVADLAPL